MHAPLLSLLALVVVVVVVVAMVMLINHYHRWRCKNLWLRLRIA